MLVCCINIQSAYNADPAVACLIGKVAKPINKIAAGRNFSEMANIAVGEINSLAELANKKLETVRTVIIGASSDKKRSSGSGVFKRFAIAVFKDVCKSAMGPMYQEYEDYYNKNFLNNNRPWWWKAFLWDVKTVQQIREELAERKKEEEENTQHIIDYKYTPLTPVFNISTPFAAFENVALTSYDIATTGVSVARVSSKLLLLKSVLSSRSDFLTECILQNSRSLENILKEYKAISDKKVSAKIFNKMLSEGKHFNIVMPARILRSCAFDFLANYMFDAYCEKVNVKLLSRNKSKPVIPGKPDTPNITSFGTVINKFTSFRTYLLYVIKRNKYLNDLILDGSAAFDIAKTGIKAEWAKLKTEKKTFIADANRAVEESLPEDKDWTPKFLTTIPNMLSSFLPLNLIKQKVGHGAKIDLAISLANKYLVYLSICSMVDSFAAFKWQEYVFQNSDILLDLVVQYNYALDSKNEEDIEICKNLISVFVADGNSLNMSLKSFYNYAKSFLYSGAASKVLRQFKYQAVLLSLAALLYGKQTLGLIRNIGSYFVSKQDVNSFLDSISLD